MKKTLLFLCAGVVLFANEVFIDTPNKLMWQDNKATDTTLKQFITRDNYYAKKFKNTNGDTATRYCQNMVLNEFDDWRLPSIEELKKLNAIQKKLQYNKIGSYYWSTTYMTNDIIGVGHHQNAKSSSWARGLMAHQKANVRCVRDIK